MKRHCEFFWLGILLTGLSLLSLVHVHAQEGGPFPTPTVDPLEEPVVPENPSEYELGRNWYWHHCMPCHGDKGQGLTDEWRAVWEPDHQDCWGRGCHTGKRIEDSFAIPTVVPPIVSSAKLDDFSSLSSLSEYLKTTHPPQSPGCLEDEQYRAIAVYVFSENQRSLLEPPPSKRPNPTITAVPEAVPVEETFRLTNVGLYAGLGVFMILIMVWSFRKRR